MADSITPIQQVIAGTGAAAMVNENFDSASPAMLFGRHAATTTGLTWGYVGGRWGGAVIASGTMALTADSVNYVVVEMATGTVSASAANTNWLNTADYARLYKAIAGPATVTAYEDHRAGPGGIFGMGSGSVTSAAWGSITGALADQSDLAAALAGSLTNPMTTAGDLIVGGAVEGGSAVPNRLAKGADGQVLKMVTGAVAWATPAAAVQCLPIACSDETTALTTGVAKVTFRMPYAMTLTAVRASVTTAPTGSVLTVDINKGGASILSTKLTIDASEKTSTTAATPAVISDSALTDDAEITIDIDGIGSTIAGTGLKVYLIEVPA